MKNKKEKDPRIQWRKDSKADAQRRSNIRAERRRQLDSATFNPDESRFRESNPNKTDIILATVAQAHRYDVKYEEARKAQAASKNPRYPCQDCGATVRLGSGGGLYDVRLRTPHYRVCGRDDGVSPEKIKAAAEMAALAVPVVNVQKNMNCLDCGYKNDFCKC